MSERSCNVPGCVAPPKRGGYCYSHYMKNWRYGTPTPERKHQWVDLIGQRFGTLVVQTRRGDKWLCLCDCGRTRIARAGDLNRTGDENTCGHRSTHRRSDDAGYIGAHLRCRQDRGPIKSHTCADCGQPASHWSYNHDDPDERHAEGFAPQPIAYSLSPEHYSPRCVPCHKRFDLNRINAARIELNP